MSKDELIVLLILFYSGISIFFLGEFVYDVCDVGFFNI